MPKTNKQRVQDKIDSALTVGELIEHLQQMDPKRLVGRTGFFGEFRPMSKGQFHACEAYLTPDGDWPHNENRVDVNILDVQVADLGPSPD